MTSLVGLGLIAAALLYGARQIVGVLRALVGDLALARAHLAAIAESPEGQFSTRLAELEHSVELLPQRWEEFKNEARRAEGRARSLIRSAQQELEGLGLEHDGLSEQARELRVVDGGGSETEAVPAVRESMEGAADPPQDWRSLAARRKYGG